MAVLVGIPTHRRPELLRQCLESIAAQEGDLPPVTVFVADNDAKAMEGVRVVEEIAGTYRFPISSTVVPEPGISAVRNAILDEVERTGVDFIAMIDDDETASPGWLAELLRVRAKYCADVVGGPSVREAPPNAPRWLQAAEAFGTVNQATGPIHYVKSTSNVLISASRLGSEEWPQFDQSFGLSGGGDTEYFLRLRRLGFSFAWAHLAWTAEPVPPERYNVGWYIRRQFRYGNTGDRLSKLHGYALTPGRTWALMNVVISPALALISLLPSKRLKALRRIAYSGGILSSAAGYRFLEYAGRHDRRASAVDQARPSVRQ